MQSEPDNKPIWNPRWLRRDPAFILTPEGFRCWREHLGLSQTEAAKLLGVVQRTVSGWELGQRRIPHTVIYAVKWLSDKDTDT